MPRERAKLFYNGRSQAVRLPKEFRLPGTEVLVHREGQSVVLSPVAKTLGDVLDALATSPGVDEAFVDAIRALRETDRKRRPRDVAW